MKLIFSGCARIRRTRSKGPNTNGVVVGALEKNKAEGGAGVLVEQRIEGWLVSVSVGRELCAAMQRRWAGAARMGAETSGGLTPESAWRRTSTGRVRRNKIPKVVGTRSCGTPNLPAFAKSPNLKRLVFLF